MRSVPVVRALAVVSLLLLACCTTAEETESASADLVAKKKFLAAYPIGARFTEGGTYDPVGHAFYVGSLADGTVRRIDAATGAETTAWHETAPGKWWSLGMDVDKSRRRLWICAMDDSQTPRVGFAWVYDLVTKKRIASHALSAAAPEATCTDVVVTNAGVAYVVDRELGRIYRVDAKTGAKLFVADPALDKPRFGVAGQNAAVVLPDQSALLSVIYGPLPRLVHVHLKTKAVREVDINGIFFDLTPAGGADGMAFANGNAYVVFPSMLVRVAPTATDWSTAKATVAKVKYGMTDAIATPNGLYLLNGQSVKFGLKVAPDPSVLGLFAGTF